MASQPEDIAMRLAFTLAALALLAAPAYAQTTPPAPVTSPETPQAAAPAQHHRMSMTERFANANTSHDGHLTLAQAKIGYKSVVRNFTEIDVTNKGYITEADIHTWQKAEHARTHAAQQAPVTPIKG
jgi:hypothetical protein